MAGPHRTKRIAINEPGHAHFLTFSCWQRLPLLSKDRSRQWVADAINQVRDELNLAIWAYVIMPEHVHLLMLPRNREYEMRRILAAIKAPVSRAAKSYLIEAGETQWLKRLTMHHGDREVFRFWQPGGGYDTNLWSERPIREIIDYIHANPVRRGLAVRPIDWEWSSARFHSGLGDGSIRIDQVVLN